MWGGKRYVNKVCMYAELFRLYSGIITQTVHRRARRRRRRGSVPCCVTGTQCHVFCVTCSLTKVICGVGGGGGLAQGLDGWLC